MRNLNLNRSFGQFEARMTDQFSAAEKIPATKQKAVKFQNIAKKLNEDGSSASISHVACSASYQ